MQCVNDLHQISLSHHHGFDRFVYRRSLVDHISVFPALDTCSHAYVIRHGESPLRLRARHRSTRAMTATLKTFWISLAAHDKGTGTHTAGNDSHVAFARADRSLPSDQNVLAVVRLPRHVIVVAVDRLQFRHERGNFTRRADGGYDLLHHQMAIPTSVVLRPLDCFHVVIKML